MPDRRTRRGAHPKDQACFESETIPELQTAVDDLSWLRSRGYSNRASLELVGNRYNLRDRQRNALQRCSASEHQCLDRRRRQATADALKSEAVIIDGYNVILTLEAALCGGVLLLGRDRVLRDLAAMSNHYHRVDATKPAVELLAEFFDFHKCSRVHLLLDRPVSNSGRLKRIIESVVDKRSVPWEVALTDKTDRVLAESACIVASADSAVLDRCDRWFNLARTIVELRIPDAWVVNLGSIPPDSDQNSDQ